MNARATSSCPRSAIVDLGRECGLAPPARFVVHADVGEQERERFGRARGRDVQLPIVTALGAVDREEDVVEVGFELGPQRPCDVARRRHRRQRVEVVPRVGADRVGVRGLRLQLLGRVRPGGC